MAVSIGRNSMEFETIGFPPPTPTIKPLDSPEDLEEALAGGFGAYAGVNNYSAGVTFPNSTSHDIELWRNASSQNSTAEDIVQRLEDGNAEHEIVEPSGQSANCLKHEKKPRSSTGKKTQSDKSHGRELKSLFERLGSIVPNNGICMTRKQILQRAGDYIQQLEFLCEAMSCGEAQARGRVAQHYYGLPCNACLANSFEWPNASAPPEFKNYFEHYDRGITIALEDIEARTQSEQDIETSANSVTSVRNRRMLSVADIIS